MSKILVFDAKFPENELTIEAVTPKKGSDIYLSGYPKPLKWRVKDSIQQSVGTDNRFHKAI